VSQENQSESQFASLAALAPWLAEQQQALLGVPGHALLLHGASGLGQYDMALSLAAAWLCEAPDRTSNSSASAASPACGQCASCRQIAARSHTDLVVLMPEDMMLEHAWPLSEKAQKELDDKKRKPSREIRIDDVRAAVSFSELTSGRGRGKVILVYPADTLNIASANALLKTLEEPAPGLRFVLATAAAHELLPTIRSRCQAYALKAPQREQALSWLASQAPQLSAEAASAALQAAGGSPVDALHLAAVYGEKAWAALPKALQRGNLPADVSLEPAQLLQAAQKLCHDLWALKLAVAPRYFAAQDLPRPPPARALAAWGEQLKSLAKQISHTWKADLLVQDMLSQAKLAINSRS
jgi:DNA polymerase III subunit delta'